MALATIVLGASKKPERYSYKAIEQLSQHEHPVVGVHPSLEKVLGADIYPSLEKAAEALGGQVDTVTMYLNPSRSADYAESLLTLNPRRVIFNPGTESESLQKQLAEAGVEVEEACTLVLLSTSQFE